MTNQRRAKAGGEIGANGEHYKGGAFIANTDAPKGKTRKHTKTGKREVAPYTWEMQPTADHRAIFSMIAGAEGMYHHDTGKMSVYLDDTKKNVREIIETFNNGQKWCKFENGKLVAIAA